MLKHITVILQAHGMYELSILKTHDNHLIKAHEKLWLLDPWYLLISYQTHAHYLSYITTSIIFITKTHGKYSNPQAHHLNYDVIIRNHETLFAIWNST